MMMDEVYSKWSGRWSTLPTDDVNVEWIVCGSNFIHNIVINR
jgi:hypothetical protein